MWLAIFTIFAITTTTIITCDLISLDNIWASTSTFHRDHDYALIGHVIKTLPLHITDCLVACQEMLRCFSVNYFNSPDGTFICELNWSSKKQRKKSFVRREGYEYAEPPNFLHCKGQSCTQKEAVENDWFKFNSSRFKIFYDKKTWMNAKAHCQNLGGDLAYFGSYIEHRFIQEIMLNFDVRELNFLISTHMETTFNLHGGASIVTEDSRKAIYFNGIDAYATIPPFEIRKTGFTTAFWFKAVEINELQRLQSGSINITIDPNTNNMTFKLKNADDIPLVDSFNLGLSYVPAGEWHHIIVAMYGNSKEFIIYHNGQKKATTISTQANTDLNGGSPTSYYGGEPNKVLMFKGWMSGIVAFPIKLTHKEIQNLKDGKYFGAWIGLNDIDNEGTLKWSNNQPLTYMSAVENQHNDRDCVFLAKEDSKFSWRVESCDQANPFICEKNEP